MTSSWWRIGLAAIAALLVQAVVFLLAPVLHALFFDPPARPARDGNPVAAVEVQVREPKPQQEQKIIRKVRDEQVKLQVASSSQARARNFTMDLDLAVAGSGEGGAGVVVGGGGMENAVYDPSEVDQQVRVLQSVVPDMPPRARRDGVGGVVKLFLVVDARGTVSKVQVLSVNPPGYGFEQEAERALRRFRFEPATLHGVPVAQKAVKEFRFEVGY